MQRMRKLSHPECVSERLSTQRRLEGSGLSGGSKAGSGLVSGGLVSEGLVSGARSSDHRGHGESAGLSPA